MFYGTFKNSSVTETISGNLFSGINGAAASNMFSSTFDGCAGLTGSIPAGLFAKITGAPADGMFRSTFNNCSGLTGEIPGNLFAGIKGDPASYMFDSMFSGCSGLTGIGSGMFNNINSGSQAFMFNDLFRNCTSLTGPSATTLDANGKTQKIWQKWFGWISAPAHYIGKNAYTGATGLSDWNCIPTEWGGGGGSCP
jgi:hypothetical protein